MTDTLVGEEDWGCGLLDVKPQVILHDRLMTDAALGTTTLPIKSEHSYCSLTSGSDSPPDSPLKMEEGKQHYFALRSQRSTVYLLVFTVTQFNIHFSFNVYVKCG